MIKKQQKIKFLELEPNQIQARDSRPEIPWFDEVVNINHCLTMSLTCPNDQSRVIKVPTGLKMASSLRFLADWLSIHEWLYKGEVQEIQWDETIPPIEIVRYRPVVASEISQHPITGQENSWEITCEADNFQLFSAMDWKQCGKGGFVLELKTEYID